MTYALPVDLCLYFQLHQPYRVGRYRIFDIGTDASYFDDVANRDTLRRVADRCYAPATAILARAAKDSGARFALSVSGVLLQQLADDAPAAYENLQALAATGGVEVLGETSHHSLAALLDASEFADQITLHRAAIKRHLGVEPASVFRNTELIVSDALIATVAKHGFKAMMVEGADHILGGRSTNYAYSAAASPNLRLLPRNYRLSDDIAFRFSARDWVGWPLTADRWAEWVAASDGEVVSVFLDFETFGEHHHPESGILDFLRALPDALRRRNVRLVTPSEAASRKPAGTLSFPTPMSWADTERDTSAWLGNDLQRAAHTRLYALRDRVIASGDVMLLETWRRLSTSDHFYYMSTKWHADGDVHTYFNPHATPYDAYISFMNVVSDLERRSGEERRAKARATPERRGSKDGARKAAIKPRGSKPAVRTPVVETRGSKPGVGKSSAKAKKRK